jgi:hypothetical protein
MILENQNQLIWNKIQNPNDSEFSIIIRTMPSDSTNELFDIHMTMQTSEKQESDLIVH